ncbi:unnamed protein product [Arctia plantaginis]|uniref:Uncharacterized protein n=1 Tax=Arctia plantaginis TaxID=874455 RepID=A0A8S0YYR6_ARCPL|nr:unnamed protein product [Arctia plantaginis]CAB3229876.1 unnamed protein product [Arctia plantaginis]
MPQSYPGTYMRAHTKPLVGTCPITFPSMVHVPACLSNHNGILRNFLSNWNTLTRIQMVAVPTLLALAFTFYYLDSLEKQEVFQKEESFFDQMFQFSCNCDEDIA